MLNPEPLLAGAVAAYSRALEKDPSLALCYCNRGACYLRLGQLDSCVSDCTRAVDLLQRQLEECEDEMDGQGEPPENLDGENARQNVGSRLSLKLEGQGLQEDLDGQDEREGTVNGQAGVSETSSKKLKASLNGEILEPALQSPEATSTPGSSEEFESKQSEQKRSEILKAPTEEGTTGDHAAEEGSIEVALPEDGALRRESKIDTSSVENGVTSQSNENGSRQIGRNGSLKDNEQGTSLEQPRSKPSDRQRVHTALVKALVRRGAAWCEQGLLPDAALGYERALRLDPENKGIEKDLEAVRDCINPPTQAEWKTRGDGRYREGDIEGAVEAYTRAAECEVRLERATWLHLLTATSQRYHDSLRRGYVCIHLKTFLRFRLSSDTIFSNIIRS
jgi:tetratricopeptide (TPR) repeat protein